MNGINEFFNRLFRGILRLVLVAAAAVFLFSLLLATLVVMLVVTVWSIVTGRKPEPAKIFGQFRQTSARYTRGAWSGGAGPGAGAASNPADIVDVPAHEVRDLPSHNSAGDKRPHGPGNDPMARMQH
jgi:hypothetical protein